MADAELKIQLLGECSECGEVDFASGDDRDTIRAYATKPDQLTGFGFTCPICQATVLIDRIVTD